MSYSRCPPNVEGMNSLKVDNLTNHTSANTLQRPVFKKYGSTGDVYILWDRIPRLSRGFTFIRFHFKHQVEDAMDGSCRMAKSFVCRWHSVVVPRVSTVTSVG
ncbi:hypothetical protein H8958_005633 [Nasalis larvatus]